MRDEHKDQPLPVNQQTIDMPKSPLALLVGCVFMAALLWYLAKKERKNKNIKMDIRFLFAVSL